MKTISYNFINLLLYSGAGITDAQIDINRNLDDTTNLDTTEEVKDVIYFVLGIENGLGGVSNYTFRNIFTFTNPIFL